MISRRFLMQTFLGAYFLFSSAPQSQAAARCERPLLARRVSEQVLAVLRDPKSKDLPGTKVMDIALDESQVIEAGRIHSQAIEKEFAGIKDIPSATKRTLRTIWSGLKSALLFSGIAPKSLGGLDTYGRAGKEIGRSLKTAAGLILDDMEFGEQAQEALARLMGFESVAALAKLSRPVKQQILYEKLLHSLQHKDEVWPNAGKILAAKFGEAFRSISQGFPHLRQNPVLLQSYIKNMTVIYATQVTGLAGNAAPVAKELGMGAAFTQVVEPSLWLFPNTGFMVGVQDEAAGRMLPSRSYAFGNLDEMMRQVPGMLHGHRGYWKDFAGRLAGFATLIPFEMVISTTFKTLNTLASMAARGHFDASKLGAGVIEGMLFPVIFGSYLSIKWAAYEKMVQLNFFPGLVRGLSQRINVSLGQLVADGLVPPQWTLTDLIMFEKIVKKYRSLLKSGGREKLEKRMSKADIKQIEAVIALHPALEGFLETPRYEEIKSQRLKDKWYYMATGAHLIDLALRWGVCLIDGYVVFWTAHTGVPWIIDTFSRLF